jgi:cobalt-zinc-cadmium efflux system protein
VHAHDHSRAADRRLLAIAFGLIVALMIGEVAAGIVAGSLALLADAGHLLTDAAALGGAFVASRLASRPARSPWTFRSRPRRDPRGAGERDCAASDRCVDHLRRSAAARLAVGRARGVVLVVALGGIAVNLVATLVLSRADRGESERAGRVPPRGHRSRRLRRHRACGALILATGWNRFDSLAALGVAALCLLSSWSLLRDSGRIFLEASPAGIDPDEVAGALAADPDVVEVHDLHIWTVTSGFPALAVHVLVSPEADCHGARRRLQRLLDDRYHLHHVTLQVDHVAQRSQPVEIATTR